MLTRGRIVTRWNAAETTNFTISNSSLTLSESTSSNAYAKNWPAIYKRRVYWEITVSASGLFNCAAGIRWIDESVSTAVNLGKTCVMRSTSTVWAGDTGATTGTGATFATGNVLGFALDQSEQRFWISVNGTWTNSGDPGAGTGALFSSIGDRSWCAYVWTDNDTGNHTLAANFGQSAFTYSLPAGFERGFTY